MNRAKRADHGFTLLETLVALAILGVVMTTVYAVIGSGLRTAHRDEDRLLLGLVAQNLLTRSQLDLDPSHGAITGDIEGGLRWRIESEPYAVPKDLLPEAPPQAEQSAFGSPDPSAAEDSGGAQRADTSSFGQESAAADPMMPDEPDETNLTQSDAEATQQEPREPLRLRLIRVLVEKGDQQFALSTLAVESPRGRNETR
jgi:type II secretion system protein I